jgi:Zn-dependent protease/CBS domain-containing protein
MFGMRWRLFRLFGIPIGVDASWLIILALLTWTLINFFTIQVPGHTGGTYVVMGLATALAFFVCIVLHELGHAVVATRVGIPMRGITLFLFGGVAEMESEPPSPRSEFLMAIAGPLVSLVLAVVFFVLAYVGLANGWPRLYAIPLLYLGWINSVVLLFNMVPAFPLDGGRVLRSILWGTLNNLRRATLWASRCGQVFAWFLIGLGVLQLFAGNLFGGIWLGIVGLFLNNAAQMSYQQVVIRQALQGEPLRRFMNTDPVTVSPDLDLHTWVEDVVYRHHHKTYPVVSDDRLHGVISVRDLSLLPREEWPGHTVGEIMHREVDAISLPPDADALEALEKMNRTGSSRLLVVEGQRLVGLISLKDLLRFLELKLELHHRDDAPGGTGIGWQQLHRRKDSSLHAPR